METNYREFIYIFKLWATALLLSPIIQAFVDHERFDSLSWLFMPFFFAVLGAIFSAPSAFILWLFALITLRYTRVHILWQKAIWSVIAAGLSFLPFRLIDDYIIPANEKQEMTIIYGAMIIAGIWVYQIKPYPKAAGGYILDEGHPVH